VSEESAIPRLSGNLRSRGALLGAPSGRRAACRFLGKVLGVALVCTLGITSAFAEQLQIPARLQAALVAKVAAYDTHFAARANGRALVLIVVAAGRAESERFGDEIRAELGLQPKIGGQDHSEEILRFTSAAEVARACRERHAAMVYIAPGLSTEISQIANALNGVDVLSVGAAPGDVEQRVVLGFARESGRPRLLVHLEQARRQNVAFNPDLLRLARVIQ
jgi:hypothetical protein